MKMSYRDTYSRFYQEQKNSILNKVRENPQKSPKDFVSEISRVYNQRTGKELPEQDAKAIENMLTEIKSAPAEMQEKSPLLDAYCNEQATKRFFAEGMGEQRRQTQSGRADFSPEYREFLDERKKECDARHQKFREYAEKCKETNPQRAEAYDYAARRYSDQSKIWDQGGAIHKTIDRNENQAREQVREYSRGRGR